MDIAINEIYVAFQGEVNIAGIGAPAIFLRTQGCHLRCYKRTMGILCDTPHALEKGKPNWKIDDLVSNLVHRRDKQNQPNLICLTGGDPLWGSTEVLISLLVKLSEEGFVVSIETSGTISPKDYLVEDIRNVHWVFDYKLTSAGIQKSKIIGIFEWLPDLRETDFVKFVVQNEEDYEEMCIFVRANYGKTFARFAVGAYWGGDLTPYSLFNRLQQDSLLKKVVLNFQTHKLCLLAENQKILNLTDTSGQI
jgi:organic radical activating enzyme